MSYRRLLDAQDWPRYAVGLATFLPDASFLAPDHATAPAADQQVAAFLLSLGHRSQTGDRTATLLSLGTCRRWHRHGLATTLINHTLAACQQAGFATAQLQVCSHNTSAVSIYTQLGFAVSDRDYALLMSPIP